MNNQLFILFREPDPDSIEWLRYEGDAFVSAESDADSVDEENPSSLQSEAQNANVIVILPAVDFSFFRVDLPAKNEKNFIKALPYSLEENVVSPIEELFFIAEDKASQTEKGRGVWVIEDVRLQAYLAILQELDIKAAHITPESALVPHADFSCSLWFEGNRVLLSHNDSFAVLAPNNLPFILDNLLSQKEEISLDDEALSEETSLEEEQNTSLSCDIMDFTGQVKDSLQHYQNEQHFRFISKQFDASQYLHTLASRFLNHPSVNLLQGKYQQKVKIVETVKRWRFAASILVAILAFQLGVTAVENAQLSSQIQALEEETNQLYKKTFPKISNLAIAKAKLQQMLQAGELGSTGKSHDGFSLVLSDVGQIILKSKKVSVKKIDYKLPNITFTIEADDVDIIDRVFAKIAKGKHKSKVVSKSNKGKVVIGTIKVSH